MFQKRARGRFLEQVAVQALLSQSEGERHPRSHLHASLQAGTGQMFKFKNYGSLY